MIIAVDGPAGAGKSTVSKLLAKKLGFLYIDTGAMYRALTLKVIDTCTNLQDEKTITDIAANTEIKLNNVGEELKVYLDDKDVSLKIREPRVTKLVSDIAKIKKVREVMLKLQRRLGENQDSILDGRDIGTVVFPDADVKFYIDANFNERVHRRYKELAELKHDVTPEGVSQDLNNRDTIDSTRTYAPLKKAADAVYIDTTNMTIDQVVQEMLKHIDKKRNG